MKTNPEALNAIIEALNGTPVETGKTIDALNEISNALGGQTGAEKLPDAIENIAAVASSGGGGSSDLSMATLTVFVDSNPSEYEWNCQVTCQLNTGEDAPINETYFTSSGAVNVVLYHGEAEVHFYCDDGTLTVASYSGDITVGDTIVLTGDAEIHISIA